MQDWKVHEKQYRESLTVGDRALACAIATLTQRCFVEYLRKGGEVSPFARMGCWIMFYGVYLFISVF